MPRTYWLETLGCKLNQADTARLEAELRARGMAAAPDPSGADLLVVNTCTVTARADSDGRQALRRLGRLNPRGRLMAIGCYARRDPETLRRLPGLPAVVAGTDAGSLADEALRFFPGDLTREAEPYHSAPAVTGRSRPLLKVQDGCNLACSYCIIPSVRGRSRSVPAEELSAALSRLIEAGFAEIVLTGVNTGDWGFDLPGSPRLLDLLRRLSRSPGLGRLRLNSLEPRTVRPDLIDFLASTDRVAQHLQIPLQSGSDRVLSRMRRNYRRGEYAALLARLAARIPDIGLGADVICGFPGESEGDFEDTVSLVRDSPLSYLHVFSFSPRPGTTAERFSGAVPPQRITARARRLRDLAARKAAEFRRQFIGRSLPAVVLSHPAPDGQLRALTGNFFEVRLPAASASPGTLLAITVLEADDGAARGVPTDRSGPPATTQNVRAK